MRSRNRGLRLGGAAAPPLKRIDREIAAISIFFRTSPEISESDGYLSLSLSRARTGTPLSSEIISINHYSQNS